MNRRSWSTRTRGSGFIELTAAVEGFVKQTAVEEGLCHVFLAHTSASLILGENADPSVRRDLEAFFSRLVPPDDPLYEHDTEGPDDMPAHIRTVLTQNSIVLPVERGALALGTWQGLYLWEHRSVAHDRRVTVTVW